jgi:hypothetical protein
MVNNIYNKEVILAFANTEFAKLEPKPDRALCLPDFDGGRFHEDLRTCLAYVRNLLAGPIGDLIASPIFRFVVGEDMDRLSTGGKKWVGIIPREMSPEKTQALAERAARTLSAAEKKALGLETEEMQALRRMIRNTLIAILHYNLKAAERTEAMNVTLFPVKGKRTEFISYKTLEEKFKELHEPFVPQDGEPARDPSPNEQRALMIQLLKEIGTLDPEASPEKGREVIELLLRAKSEAWELLDKLDKNMQLAQRRAKIPGQLAEMDINVDHTSLPLFEHLRAVYGLSPNNGKTVEDRYELQTAGDLLWLLARLSNHPIYKNLLNHKDEVEQDFTAKVFHSGVVFKKSGERKMVYLDVRGRLTDKDKRYNTWDPEVYDSTLSEFDDLTKERKQIYRSRFRPKEKSAVLVKTMRDREDLAQISDALAGEAVMMGINEKDLNPEKCAEAERLQAFMIAQAEAIGASLGLKKAPDATPYRKIPRGTYKIVPKLEPSTSKDSFNFPAVKIYINYPIGEDSTSEEGESIRTEYRLVCQDTWLRANKQTDSMSHHDMYKMKQGVDLLDILTARAYNGGIHPAANKFRRWVKRKERKEMQELSKAA